MKKLRRGLFAFMVLVLAGGVCLCNSRVNPDQAKAASYYGTDSVLPDFTEYGNKGTESNPFVILEIVPYEGYAEIGYMISGCEPIPLEQLAFDNVAGGLVASTGGLSCQWKVENKTSLDSGDVIGNGPGQWQLQGDKTYQRNRNYFSSNNSFLKYALGVSQEQLADYKIQVITVTPEVLNNLSNYRFIDRADLIYISPKSHYGSDLVTLWEKYHPEKVQKNKATDFSANDLTWETALRILRKSAINNDASPVIFDVTSFSTDQSYHQQISPKKYYSTGTAVTGLGAMGYTGNVAKLYLVMQLMDPAKFYHDFIETGKVKSVKVRDSSGKPIVRSGVEMTTGYFTELVKGGTLSYYQQGTADASVAWNIYTLLPYQLFKNYEALAGNKAFEAIGYKVFTYDGDQTHTSIRHNLYAYNGDNSITQIFLSSNISENQYNREAFDYFEKIRGSRPASLDPAEAINYLLHISNPVYEKSQLKILEVEPCNDFIWDGTSYATEYFKRFCPHFSGTLQVTTMTSGEFIGKVEELNSTYDLIFFGLRDGTMRKNSSGATIYNDTTLNNKVYLHVGDKIIDKTNLRGTLGASDTNDIYRFSGNDITGVKLSELERFMSAGYPVVLGEGFLQNDMTINTGKLDNTSRIYQLASEPSDSLYFSDRINIVDLEHSLTSSRCHIIFGKTDGSVIQKDCYPLIYRDKSKDSSLTDKDIYINGSDINNRSLQYQFYIQDNSGTVRTYEVALYIDINADGKFDPSTETLYGLNVRTDDGYPVDSDRLKAGMNYQLTLELDQSFTGILPWKLEITDTANRNDYDSVINYSALKVENSNKVHLNVLQIRSDTDNNLDLMNHTLFKKYADNLNDYVLHFKSITVSEFNALCGTGAYHYILSDSTEARNLIKNKNGLYVWDDYDKDGQLDVDMLILGFADMYSDISNENSLRNIEEYIDEGKTVLFTHDTTSFVNLPKEKYTYSDFWGYHLNQRFRNVFGMDRFGVTGYKSKEERLAAGKDYTTDQYLQGYTDTNLNRYAETGQYFSNINFPESRDIVEESVTKLNEGQITRYPYEIDDSFQVAKTHSQYYQLDLESDDTVVWFCLSDDSKDVNGKPNGIYSTTPNDARNNYYIYNKGNITYSGVGHSAIAQDSNNAGAVMETKLFINTIVAAYSATVQEPVIDITNSNKSTDSSGMDYLYVDYDIYKTEKSYGLDLNLAGQKLKYRILDNNVLYNEKMIVKYYTVDPVTGSETEIALNTYKESNSSLVHELQSKTDYFALVPLGELDYKNKGNTMIIRVTLTYGKKSSYTITFDKKFTLVRRGLFDLD